MSKIVEELVLPVSLYLDRLNIALKGERGFVSGEVTEFRAGDKWVGFTLKDPEPADGKPAVLKCVLNAYAFRKIGVNLEDGMLVKLGGVPRVSKGWGSLGFWVESIEPLGEGSLKKAYELLLKKLNQEGLFARKRELPEFVSDIGVVSSREGVVIQDLQQNLKKLGIKINFIHTNVEGASAVPGLLRAIEYFNKKMPKLDAIVLIRGGGSFESLQAYNNEAVCRAVFGSKIPVVAGIGHDTDVPLVSMVADASASTPTGVAHIINETWDSLTHDLPRLEREIINSYSRSLSEVNYRVSERFSRMEGYFREIFTLAGSLESKIIAGFRRVGETLEFYRESLTRMERLLTIADPARNLRLGYSIVRDAKGKVLKSVKEINKGDMMSAELSDGKLELETVKVDKK